MTQSVPQRATLYPLKTVFRHSVKDREQLARIAADENKTTAAVLREMIVQEYEDRYGTKPKGGR